MPPSSTPSPLLVPAAPSGAAGGGPAGGSAASWTFLTNHSHVLICLARRPDATLREVADAVGITERAVQGIVADLEAAGVLTRTREGRRNRYTLHPDKPLRHPVESHRTIGDVLRVME